MMSCPRIKTIHGQFHFFAVAVEDDREVLQKTSIAKCRQTNSRSIPFSSSSIHESEFVRQQQHLSILFPGGEGKRCLLRLIILACLRQEAQSQFHFIGLGNAAISDLIHPVYLRFLFCLS